MNRSQSDRALKDSGHAKLKQALHASSERYELLSKATNDAIYELHILSGTMQWNDALEAAYGYGPADREDTLEWWTSRIHPDDALEVEVSLSRLLISSRNTWQSDYRFRCKNGEYAHVRNRAYVQRGDGGEPLRIIGSLLDLTTEYQLDRAKDEFISLVSHQLRTPLTIIRLFSDILASGKAGELGEQQKECASNIRAASVRMIGLVNDILDISRIELDRIKVEPVLTDVKELIGKGVKNLRPLIDQKELTVIVEPIKATPPIPLDPAIFTQIINTLLMNAIRYTEPKKGIIRINFVKRRSGFVFSVEDNGIGIPKRAQPHIFSRFYRAENAARFIGEGSGLGLYLIKIITDIFKGKVWFKSQEGEGSTFYVRLPLIGMTAKAGTASLHPVPNVHRPVMA
jgi:PAS domain S-box-containing protein